MLMTPEHSIKNQRKVIRELRRVREHDAYAEAYVLDPKRKIRFGQPRHARNSVSAIASTPSSKPTPEEEAQAYLESLKKFNTPQDEEKPAKKAPGRPKKAQTLADRLRA